MRYSNDKQLIWYKYMFLLFSIIGWLYEMGLFIYYGKLHEMYNRGFLYGPYLPIYGFGTLLLIIFVYPLIANDNRKYTKFTTLIIAFILVLLITTGLELIASYFIELLGLPKLWDYSNFKYNFQGRISLNHSLRFAFGGVFFLYLVIPFFSFIINKFPYRKKALFINSLLFIMLIDFLISAFLKILV